MTQVSKMLDRCSDAVALAKRLGADAADAVASASASQSVSVRLGALEDVERSEGEEIALRVFVGQRTSSVSTSEFSREGLEQLVERAVAMARLAPEDPYAGLAPEDHLYSGTMPDLELADDAEPSSAQLRTRAEQVEEAARAVKGVTNSDGGSASASRSTVALATSHGFAGGYTATGHGISASVIAGEGADMQRDYAHRSARHLADLPSPSEIGTQAGERTINKLGPRRLASGTMPVVFDRRVSASLISHLVGAMTGPAIARKASFLLGREEEDLFPAGLSLIEEPHRKRGLRSRIFDGEGIATQGRSLIEHKRLTGWLTHTASARQLGVPLTGHASRGGSGPPGVSVSNLHVPAGERTPDELIADIGEGLYVTELIGQGVNGITGDYSRGASGFAIRDGKKAEPISEITIAGNLLAMFAAMEVGSDLEWHRAINVPTLRVEQMSVAGE